MSKTPDLRIDKTIGQILASQGKPKLQAETGWYNVGEEWAVDEPITVDFLNSWDNSGVATEAPASWWLSESGEGRLRGKIRGGTIGLTAFILPEEIVPKHKQEFLCSIDDNGNIDLSNIRFRAWQEGDTEV